MSSNQQYCQNWSYSIYTVPHLILSHSFSLEWQSHSCLKCTSLFDAKDIITSAEKFYSLGRCYILRRLSIQKSISRVGLPTSPHQNKVLVATWLRLYQPFLQVPFYLFFTFVHIPIKVYWGVYTHKRTQILSEQILLEQILLEHILLKHILPQQILSNKFK